MKSEEDESDLTKSNGGNHGDGLHSFLCILIGCLKPVLSKRPIKKKRKYQTADENFNLN